VHRGFSVMQYRHIWWGCCMRIIL